MFMIAAVFMIIGFVLLKSLLSLPGLSQEKAFQDMTYLNRNLNNIRAEYGYIAGMSSVQPNANSSGAAYMSSFSSYMRGEFDSRILYVYVFSNGTTGNFSATLGNYLQNNISGTLNFTNSSPAGYAFNLNDSSSAVFEFTGANATVNATLNYTLQNSQTAEKFYFNASTRNSVAAFFDLMLQDNGFMVRSKSTYNRTW